MKKGEDKSIYVCVNVCVLKETFESGFHKRSSCAAFCQLLQTRDKEAYSLFYYNIYKYKNMK